MVLKECEKTDCFANVHNRCDILTSTKFKSGECPFHKHRDEVNREEIERICTNYEIFHAGRKLASSMK